MAFRPRRKKREPKDRAMLEACFESGLELIEEEMLPGAQLMADGDDDVTDWLRELEHRIRSAIADEDEVLFERSLASLIRAWERINELIAEEYRERETDPEQWELRYVKWMKIKFIRFESPEFGTFYVVPQRPRRKPRTNRWYTVDEMIDMLHPTVSAAIKTFGELPSRPEDVPGPAPGEKHMQIDLTGPKPVITYTFKRGKKDDREGLRGRSDSDGGNVPPGGDDQVVGQLHLGNT